MFPLFCPLPFCQPVIDDLMHSCLPMSVSQFPRVCMPVVMGQHHVLQAVVLSRRRGGVRESIGGRVEESIAGTVSLGGACGAWPLGKVIRVETFLCVLFGPVRGPPLAILIHLQ